MLIELPDNWMTNECGNTWLSRIDSHDHIAWFKLPGTTRLLEVEISEDSYPGMYVSLAPPEHSDPAVLAAHIMKHHAGWLVHKCNVVGVQAITIDGQHFIADEGDVDVIVYVHDGMDDPDEDEDDEDA
jgi:hypothetical protein